MNKIPKSEQIRKWVRVIRGGLGYVVKGQGHDKCHGVKLPKRTRGDITRFSAPSARRLRETLAMAKFKDGKASVWGFTFTIPGKVLPPSEVRRLWHDFVRAYTKQYRDVPMVWRIELQVLTRRQAHWHCVLWIDGNATYRAVMIAELWRKVVRSHVGVLSRKTDRGFDLHGVDMRCLDGATATGLIGYLCDHASKHKREQLGWRGRQWGVVNRDALDFEGVLIQAVHPDMHLLAARQFRRLQEHLRRDGVYTGGAVTPYGEVMRSVFGKDAERLLKCYDAVRRGW